LSKFEGGRPSVGAWAALGPSRLGPLFASFLAGRFGVPTRSARRVCDGPGWALRCPGPARSLGPSFRLGAGGGVRAASSEPPWRPRLAPLAPFFFYVCPLECSSRGFARRVLSHWRRRRAQPRTPSRPRSPRRRAGDPSHRCRWLRRSYRAVRKRRCLHRRYRAASPQRLLVRAASPAAPAGPARAGADLVALRWLRLGRQ